MDGVNQTDEQTGDDPRDQMEVARDTSMDYWATLEGKELCSAVDDKQRSYFESARKRGLLGMWIVSYAAHHGLDPDSMSTFQTQQLGFDGEQAEFLRLCINIVRTYIQRQSTTALGEKPHFQALALNSDVKSQLGAELSSSIMGNVFKRAGGEPVRRDLDIAAQVVGASFWHLTWDANAGDVVTVQKPVTGKDGQPLTTVDEQGQQVPAMLPTKQRSGWPQLSVGYPWTVFQEPEAARMLMWRAVRVPDNKFNLMATYPALAKDIYGASTDDEWDFGTLFGFEGMAVDNKDACTTIHFYHARCAAMPEGRYAIMLDSIVLHDGPLPTTDAIPVFEHCPARFIMTNFGYAPSWDLLSIQQALNQIVSDQLSNIATYGRQTIALEKGTEITVDALASGNKSLFYPQGGKPPQAVLLNDIGTGPTTLQQYLHKMLDDVSGQNAAARGDPESNVKSGSFAALLHTTAAEYMSYAQASLDSTTEAAANGMLDMIRTHGETPFLIEIVGMSEASYVKEFTAEKFDGIKRFYVETVAPTMQSVAGRLDMHDRLKDYAPEDRAAAYELMMTGRSDAFMKRARSSQLYIRRENERLLEGELVGVHDFDDPFKHAPEHVALIQSLLAADEPNVDAIQRASAHVIEHAQKYGNMHPFIAAFLKIQPPPPQPGTTAFDFAMALAQGAAMISVMSGGMPAQPDGGPQVQEPQPGEAGSMRPKTAPKDAAGPGGDNTTGAAQPGGSGRDSSGVPLPEKASPPPQAAMQQQA